MDHEDKIHWRMQVLREFQWWPYKEGVGLLHETQRWSVSTLFEFQSNGGQGEWCEHQMPKVWWKGKVFLKWIQCIFEGTWNSKEIFMQLFPQHNGIVEMENMHIVEITHAMLNEFFLLDYF